MVTSAVLCVVLAKAAFSDAADWPQFGRDGTRNPVSPERRPPTNWDVGQPVGKDPRQRVAGSYSNIKWSAPLGTRTLGDPVVVDGLVWVGTNNGYAPKDHVDASVLACFRESDGKLLYRHVSPRLSQGQELDWEHRSLSCSPFIEKDRLWFVTNRAEVVCLDIGPLHRGEGAPKQLWQVDLIDKFGVFPRSPMMGWAHTCSIAGYQKFLYVITGNGADKGGRQVKKPEAPSLVCLRRDTGETVWQDKSPGENILDGQWSSPTIIEIDGRAQCVAGQGDGWVRSFDALTGQPIWQFDMNRKDGRWALFRSTRNSIMAAPVFAEGRLYIASGLNPEFGERPGRLVCLDPTKRGDISSELAVDGAGNVVPHRRVQAVDPERGEKAVPNPNSGLVWEYAPRGDKRFSDMMHGALGNVAVHKGLVIAPDSTGFVHCLDAKTGNRYWVCDALATIYGSPLIVDDKAYVADTDGDVMIFRLSSDPAIALRGTSSETLPLRQISMPYSINCAPIFANGTLYLATDCELFAITNEENGPDADLTGGYWPQWRGPHRDNASSEKGLLPEWPEGGPPLLWMAVGIGEGIASVSLIEGRIFTLGYQDDSEFVVALEEVNGELSWATRIGPAVAENPLMRWLTQRTPTVDEERLYAITAKGDLVCLDTSHGREVWRKNYVEEFGARQPAFGFGEYPLVDEEYLVCTPGGPTAAMAAIHKSTGAVVWKSALPAPAGAAKTSNNHEDYSGIVVTELGGQRQYVTFLDHRLTGIAAASGRLLWRYEALGNDQSNSHTPLVCGESIFCSSSATSEAALLRLVGKGQDIECQDVYHSRQVTFDRFVDASTIVGDHIFASWGAGVQCIAWKNGERVWAARIPGQSRVAMTYADDRLYLRGSEGQMILAGANPAQFVMKGTFAIPAHEKSLGATLPVVAGKRLYVRDENRLLCYDIRADALAKPRAQPRTVKLDVPAATRAGNALPASAARERPTPKGVFVPTPRDVVKQMLTLAGVKKSDVVYDLGSGDGRIVIAAAKEYGCRAVGYELDPELVKLSRETVRTHDLETLVTIEMADVFTADLTLVDVVTLYLLPQQLEKLVPQLKKLKPGSRVVSHQFEIPGMPADKQIEVASEESGARHTIYLWTLPFKGAAE